MKHARVYPSAAVALLLLAGCSSGPSFPQHTTFQGDAYPASMMTADLEIVTEGNAFCPYLTFEGGERVLLVLEEDAKVTASSIEWQGNLFTPGPVTGGGGASTIDYDDAGCERTEKIWILSPAN